MHPRERDELEARLQMLRATVTEQAAQLAQARAELAEARQYQEASAALLARLTAELAEARQVMERVTGIIEALGQDLANITATRDAKGMQVPWHGPFTVALTHPSTMRDLIRLHGDLARALSPKGES
jgi:hypothetical protein